MLPNGVVALDNPSEVSLKHMMENRACRRIALCPEHMNIERGHMNIRVLRVYHGGHGPQAILDDGAHVELGRVIADDGCRRLEGHSENTQLLMCHLVNDGFGQTDRAENRRPQRTEQLL